MSDLDVKKEVIISQDGSSNLMSDTKEENLSDVTDDHNYCINQKTPPKLNKPKRTNVQISDEKRKSIIEALETEMVSIKEAAKLFDVKYSSVARIYHEFNKYEKIASKKRGGTRKKKLNDHELKFVQELMIEDCTLTLKEIQAHVQKKFDKYTCISTLFKYLNGFHYSIKRVHKMEFELETPELDSTRKDYCTSIITAQNTNKNILFYDETRFQVSIRSCGRTEKHIGKESVTNLPKVKHRYIRAVMSKSGLLLYKSQTTTESDLSLVDFLPSLFEEIDKRKLSDILIVMDNTTFNKCLPLKPQIDSRKYKLQVLPPCSSSLSAFENFFTQWPAIVRNQCPANEHELLQTIDGLQNIITPEQCEKYFKDMIKNLNDYLSNIS